MVPAFGRTNMNNPASRRQLLVVFLIFLVGSAYWIWFRLYTKITLEDAFITFRYAQNLALGKGFVFNEGERVLGTTTPLLTVILALLGRMTDVDAIPLLSTGLGVSFGALTSVLTYGILVTLGYSRLVGYLSMAIYFASARILVATVGGMETPLVLFLMALSFYLLLRHRYTLSLVACSLLLLTRIDGVLWASLLLAATVARTKRLSVRWIGACGAILIPWTLFAVTYFGSVLPHSVTAKQIIRFYPPKPTTPLAAITAFLGWFSSPSGFGMSRAMFVLCAGLLCFGAWKTIRDASTRAVGTLLLAFSPLFAVFLWFGDAPHFDWYPVPALWANLVLCVIGVEATAAILVNRLRPVAWSAAVRPVLFVGLVGSYVAWQGFGPVEWHYKFQANEIGADQALGLWLRRNAPVGSVVAMEAIGYQGFYSQRKVVDLAGLVSPTVVELRRESRSNAEVFQKVVTQLRPDYIVLRSSEIEKNRHFHGGPLFENDQQKRLFFGCYREVKRFRAPYPEVWGDFAERSIFERAAKQCGGAT